MEEIKEPEFTQEQLIYIEKLLKEEAKKIIKEIQDNYVPRVLIEGMLKALKERKVNCDVKYRELFIDGGIWVIQEILKKED